MTTDIGFLRPSDVGELEALGAEIRLHLAQAELLDGLAWEHRLETGRLLEVARQHLAVGELTQWIDREIGVSDRHARRLMLLWRERTRVSAIVKSDREASLRGVLDLLRGADDRVEDDHREPPALRPTSLFDEDPAALGTLLAIHARPAEHPRVIDVTYGHGRLWRGLRRQYNPSRADVDPSLQAQGFTDVCADWSSLPFEVGAFDVLVFDPPHITDAGADSIMGSRYGSLKGTSIAAVFEPLLLEAKRVLQPATGLLVAKLANQVHNARYQDQARAFANIAEALGFVKVDEAIRTAPERGTLNGSWSSIQHLRQVHSYWLALRAPKGSR